MTEQDAYRYALQVAAYPTAEHYLPCPTTSPGQAGTGRACAAGARVVRSACGRPR